MLEFLRPRIPVIVLTVAMVSWYVTKSFSTMETRRAVQVLAIFGVLMCPWVVSGCYRAYLAWKDLKLHRHDNCSQQLDPTKAEELAELEEDWEEEREEYVLAFTKGRSETVATKGACIQGSVPFVIFLVLGFWLLGSGIGIFPGLEMGPFACVLISIPFLIMGAIPCLHIVLIGRQYQKAYERYQQRRSQLLGNKEDRNSQ